MAGQQVPRRCAPLDDKRGGGGGAKRDVVSRIDSRIGITHQRFAGCLFGHQVVEEVGQGGFGVVDVVADGFEVVFDLGDEGGEGIAMRC
jgi:hypothetical protein